MDIVAVFVFVFVVGAVVVVIVVDVAIDNNDDDCLAVAVIVRQPFEFSSRTSFLPRRTKVNQYKNLPLQMTFGRTLVSFSNFNYAQ